jgi:hypothetical protein
MAYVLIHTGLDYNMRTPHITAAAAIIVLALTKLFFFVTFQRLNNLCLTFICNLLLSTSVSKEKLISIILFFDLYPSQTTEEL